MPKKVTISIGSKAPDFVLKDQDGRLVRLSDFRGKKVILFFYVRDDTPGCTRESCDFRDRMENIHSMNVVVLGVSPDSVESHKRFVEKYRLTFPLLADEDASLAKKFGVWRKKNMYGRTFYGIIRSTFVINEEGRVEKEFRHVKVDGHLDRVLREI
ncbi:MAG TPA: thioredoxin-dependent thiol peroxidase [Candidatus Bathyarchaeia archaeon]|nr:thioredoxin-dependent thiol peroxidase [Candidatus Bathyarchaeia archaeon]